MKIKLSWLTALLIIAPVHAMAQVSNSKDDNQNEKSHAIAFAISQEVYANGLESKGDVCLGFGHDLGANENSISFILRNRGLKLRSSEWCNHGPRGWVVAVIAPVRNPRGHVYEIVIELGDLAGIKAQGEHFGTLVRRGTYTVQIDESIKAELLAYRKSCCPE